MLHYFFLLEETFFRWRLRPVLAECRRTQSFNACKPLCRELLKRSGDAPDSLMAQVSQGLAYQARTWQALIGELLAAGAEQTPRLSLNPCLLCSIHGCAPERHRPGLTPVQQALYGAKEVDFGVGVYRPEHAGLNDSDDVRRLTAYLESVDPATWSRPAMVDTEDFADSQASWPELVSMYQAAQRRGWLVISEEP
jgi:hypothetical protein